MFYFFSISFFSCLNILHAVYLVLTNSSLLSGDGSCIIFNPAFARLSVVSMHRSLNHEFLSLDIFFFKYFSVDLLIEFLTMFCVSLSPSRGCAYYYSKIMCTLNLNYSPKYIVI